MPGLDLRLNDQTEMCEAGEGFFQRNESHLGPKAETDTRDPFTNLLRVVQ